MATANSTAQEQAQIVALPPPGQAAPAGKPRASRGFSDFLAGTVLVFTFLAASSVVRNSDFWLHLATGRLLARGDYHFGHDPFALTTTDVYWANHAWLFDLCLYLLYTLVGGTGLVILKALGLTALAGVLLSIRRREGPGGLAVAAACTALAVLAMSPRLLLQPVCVSYFLLGLALWLLWRRQAGQLRRLWLLPAVCALWVNLDSWFLLGPLLIALFFLGQRLQPWLPGGEPVNETARLPAWLIAASLVACLLGPHHYHAFTLPGELYPLLSGSGLRQDVRFARLFASPWQFGTALWPAGRFSLAGLAYFVLVGLGLLSFLANRRSLSGWRLLVWLVFGLLAAASERLVPFFAVVAGPITALNFQDFLARQVEARQAPRLLSFVLRPLIFVLLLALVGLAWPGWLNGLGQTGRRVAWAVQPDPSLQRVARTLSELRRQGRLGQDDRAFLFHPDVAHYCAWFCPEVRGFIDHRLGLFSARTIRDYEEVCRALNPGLAGLARSDDKDFDDPGRWQVVLRERGITFFVLYDPDLARLFPALRRVAVNPQRWSLLSIDGKALVVGWNEAERRAGPAFTQMRLSPERLAFGPQGEQEQAALPAAPAKGPDRPPAPPSFWSPFVQPPRLSPWEADAGAVYLRYLEDTRRVTTHRQALAGAQRLIRMAGCLALPSGPAPAVARLLAVLRLGDLPVAAEPLLAVRAARLGLADHPDDARTHALLGRAYQILGALAGEGGLPPLAMLRHIQIATALEQAVLLNPDLEAAHDTLAQMYRQRNYLDLALEHLREQLRLARRSGPQPGEDADDFNRRMRPLELRVEELERLVEEAQNRFAVAARGQGTDPLGRAQLALRLGLARVALDDVLLKSHVLLFGTAGAQLEIELLLMTGRAEEARAKLDDEELKSNKTILGLYQLSGVDARGRPLPYALPAYDWLLACQSAATGDYDVLGDALGALFGFVEERLARDRRQVSLAVTDEIGLRSQGSSLLLHMMTHHRRLGLTALLESNAQTAADLHALAGVLALERGAPEEAEAEFRAALRPGGEQSGRSSPGRQIAFAYLQEIGEQAGRGPQRER